MIIKNIIHKANDIPAQATFCRRTDQFVFVNELCVIVCLIQPD